MHRKGDVRQNFEGVEVVAGSDKIGTMCGSASFLVNKRLLSRYYVHSISAELRLRDMND